MRGCQGRRPLRFWGGTSDNSDSATDTEDGLTPDVLPSSSCECGPGTTCVIWTSDTCSLGGPCNPWLDECPEGEACRPTYSGNLAQDWWVSSSCKFAGPAAVGEPCLRAEGIYAGEDDCVPGAICWAPHHPPSGTLR